MARFDLKSSTGARLAIIVILTFLLMLPSFMIMILITERQQRRDTVANEISGNWGSRQTVIGPVLSIPVKEPITKREGEKTGFSYYAHFLPERLEINGVILPEVRNRSIYDVIVYKGEISLSAVFKIPKLEGLSINKDDLLIDQAAVSLGISDMKGVSEAIRFDWNGELIEANPGIPSNDIFASGVNVPVKIGDEGTEYGFKTNLKLNGSFELLFAPVGKETELHLSSAWPNPSFSGAYLPAERKLDVNGFQADWKVFHISRDFPQQWVGARYDVNKSSFGVSLLLSVDQYQQTMRTVKYAIMFIALTFLTFFVIEIRSSKPIHPIQYLLVGLALLIFYTLLLSLSEYISFGFAYLIASVAIIAMISFYSRSFLGERYQPAIVALIMGILYGYLYIVLQLQDYALLMGSIILFIALAALMFLTRKIDWFGTLEQKK
jgi:inner membrane protein